MKAFFLAQCLIICSLLSQQVHAQTQRVRPSFQHGDIVASTTGRIEGDHQMANQSNAENMIGVFNTSSTYKTTPEIYTSGIAYVKFDASNGAVVPGDYITASSQNGKGMKATQSGMVIGVALEPSTPTSELIKIRVQPVWVQQTAAN